jgi:hypothetical protein
MFLLLFGPISSGSPDGPGPFFSVLFLFLGVWMLMRLWREHSARRADRGVSTLVVVGLAGLAIFFIFKGASGLVR